MSSTAFNRFHFDIDHIVPRFIPRFFEKDISSGAPTLTPHGRIAVQEELAEDSPYRLEGHEETAGSLEYESTVAKSVLGS